MRFIGNVRARESLVEQMREFRVAQLAVVSGTSQGRQKTVRKRAADGAEDHAGETGQRLRVGERGQKRVRVRRKDKGITDV